MNRKSIYYILPLIALVLMSCQLASAPLDRQLVQATGPMVSEARPVSGVERVQLEDIGNLTIVQGAEEGLTVEANQDLLPYIVTEMRGRELVVKIKDGYRVTGEATIRYTLQIKNIDRVTVAGAGNVRAAQLEAGDLALIVAGAGNMTIDDLQARALRAESSGAGNFTLSGSVESQQLTINGVGNFSASDLRSQQASVTINGTGDGTVWAEDSLDVRIGGFGSVNYYGSPSVTQSITGAGAVNSLGAHP